MVAPTPNPGAGMDDQIPMEKNAGLIMGVCLIVTAQSHVLNVAAVDEQFQHRL
jgi:hypothetical protein